MNPILMCQRFVAQRGSIWVNKCAILSWLLLILSILSSVIIVLYTIHSFQSIFLWPIVISDDTLNFIVSFAVMLLWSFIIVVLIIIIVIIIMYWGRISINFHSEIKLILPLWHDYLMSTSVKRAANMPKPHILIGMNINELLIFQHLHAYKIIMIKYEIYFIWINIYLYRQCRAVV